MKNKTRICRTPGAVFHITIKEELIGVQVNLNKKVHLTRLQAAALEDQLHDALEEILAPFWGPTND